MKQERLGGYIVEDYGNSSPEVIIQVDTTIIQNAVRLIAMYQRGIGINGSPIDTNRAQKLIAGYYDLMFSSLNRSGESLNPLLVQQAHEVILDSSLSL